MFGRISNSWNLMGSCFHVLAKDKELLIFPLLSGIACVALLASFAGGMYGTGMLDEIPPVMENQDGERTFNAESIPHLVAGFTFYFVSYFVVIYFNAALVGAAYIRLHGGDPTVSDGFAAANRCLGSIFIYAFIAALVGWILRMIEQRSRWVGRLVVGLIGMAWTLMTFLVVPVMVIERVSATKAISRSAALFRETWGEQLVGNFSFGIISFLLIFPALLLGGGAFFLFAMGGAGGTGVAMAPAIGIACVVVLYVLTVSVVISALQGIYTAALYAYAAHHEVRGFPVDLVSSAFSPRHNAQRE